MTDQTVLSPPLRRAAAVTTPTAAPTAAGLSALAWPVWLYLFCVLVPFGVQAGPLTLTGLRLLLILLVLPLTAQLLAGRYGRLRPTDIFFLLYILWATIAIAVNNPGRTVEYIGSTGAEFIGGYVVARAYIRTREAFAALARVLIIFLVVTLPLTLMETVTGQPPVIQFLRSIPGNFTVGIVNYEPRMGLERVQLSFAHPIHFGLFCSMVFPLAFVALKGRIPTLRRYLASGLVLLCGFLSLSSGALLALILHFIMIGWNFALGALRPRARWYLLLGLVALLYIAIDILSTRTPIRVFMSYATFSAHTAYMRANIFDWGMVNVWRSPIFGIGLKDWVRASYMVDPTVDNFWLLTTMRFGFPGLFLLSAGYLIGIAQVIKRNFETDPLLNNQRLAWVFTFVGLTFTLSTVAIWTSLYSFVFFMFGAGLWMIAAEPAGTATGAGAPQARAGRPAPAARRPMTDRTMTDGPITDRPIPDGPATGRPADPAAGVPRYTRFPPKDRGPRPAGGEDPPAA